MPVMQPHEQRRWPEREPIDGQFLLIEAVANVSRSERIIAGANAEIEQEMNRAREALREQVGAIAVTGAEKILERSIDQAANEELLSKLAAEL